MSNLDTLFDKLRSQSKTSEKLWKAERQKWIDELERLWATISDWLKKGVDEGLIRLDRRTVTFDEEEFGTYEVPALDLHFKIHGHRVIKIEPKAIRVIGVIPTPDVRILGAAGRVDLRCGPARAMLIRRPPGKWQFVGVDRGFSSEDLVIDLTPDSLCEAINELLG